VTITTTDNANNSSQNAADGDMDTCLWANSTVAPIEFYIPSSCNITPPYTVKLLINAYDVDYSGSQSCGPEIDKVYINNHYLGNLTGADGNWSTTTFNVEPAWINRMATTLSGWISIQAIRVAGV